VPRLSDALARVGRTFGKPPGWERLVRAIAPPASCAGDPLLQMTTAEGCRFAVDRGTLIGWHLYFFGDYEPEVRREIRAALHPGGTAIDVGANVGWHTLLMASLAGADGRVVAVEPNPTTRERLEAAVAANGFVQVQVESRALADRAGSAAFEAPPAGDLWDGTGRLVRDASAGTSRVACTTLDALCEERGLDRVSLVKIDVEGWEAAVLRGGRRLLAECRPAVIFEYDPAYVSRCGSSGEELSQLFLDAGYRLFALPPRRARHTVDRLADRDGNFLAVPAERAVDG
jgi:FkbM family methyltransferase